MRFPPPLIFATGFLLGWILEVRVRSLPMAGAPSTRAVLEVVGALGVVGGLVVAFWGLWTFHRAHTAILPHRPASRLVTSGPYRFSRNPMYVGLTAAYIGLAMLANTLWPPVFLPLVITALYLLVVRREERYLGSAFGAEYAEYRRRIRRWL